MQIAEKIVPIQLGGKTYNMVCDANTMVAFEEVTGKFFMDTVSSLYDTLFPKGHQDKNGKPVQVKVSGMDIVRKISMTDLRALLWASFHNYNAADEPVWPMTISQIGRQLNFQNVIPIFVQFLTSVSSNSPSKDDMGESEAEAAKEADAPATESMTPNSEDPGGEVGIALPAGALD